MQGVTLAPDGKIIYRVITNDRGAIWEMNADGAEQRQLTNSLKDSKDSQISVTADNRYLVFESNRSGQDEIWRANRDGSNLKQLTDSGRNSQPALSPDGKWAVFAALRDGKSTLWRVSIEGGEPFQITVEESSWPDVSPDGKYLACVLGKSVEASDKRIGIFPSQGGRPSKYSFPRKMVFYSIGCAGRLTARQLFTRTW